MIIIIGNGILGSVLARKCKEKHISIVQHTHQTLDLTWNLQDITHALNESLWDVRCNKDDLCVINAAAYTNVDKAESEYEQAYAVNASGAYKLATACKTLGLYLIHVSTDFVFNGMSSKPYTELDKPFPMNAYGKSKFYGEKFIKNSGCNHAVVRTGWLYNDNKGIIPNIVKFITENTVVEGVSDQLFAPTHAEDLSEQLLVIYRNNLTGLYHATAKGSVSPLGVIDYISEKLYGGRKETNSTNLFRYFMGRANRPKNCILEHLHLDALGLDIMPPWQNRIDLLLNKFKEKKNI